MEVEVEDLLEAELPLELGDVRRGVGQREAFVARELPQDGVGLRVDGPVRGVGDEQQRGSVRQAALADQAQVARELGGEVGVPDRKALRDGKLVLPRRGQD